MARKETILIVDDHPLVRDGLKSIIKTNDALEVIGEAETARDAIRMVKKLKPDLVLLDLGLPDKSGFELAREIRSMLPKIRIMIVSMHSKVDYIVKAFQAGATGYMTKESATKKLLQGVAQVLNGDYFIDGAVSNAVVEKLIQTASKRRKIADAGYETLTPREQEIMVLLAEGYSAKEAAEKLFISPKTVENRRYNIMNKLELHSTFELVRYAARLGLVNVGLWKNRSVFGLRVACFELWIAISGLRAAGYGYIWLIELTGLNKLIE
ncbi:MAG: response regulator transcription factor [Desulfobacteraceae bacterium]|jgi:DNA-binding NarL/FixJ family response regulator|nr:response regulator transcription factor [Desulfobacteraceae bacterium]